MIIKTGTIVKTIDNNIYYRIKKVFTYGMETYYSVDLVHIVKRTKGTFVVITLRKQDINKSWVVGNKSEQVLYG